MKGGHKVAHKTTTRKVHFATLFQKYEYIPVNVRKSNLKCGNFFVLHELVHRRRFLGFRTHVVVTTVCETGGVHTLCCRMHIFCTALRTSAHLHACEHTHGPRLWKRFCCMRMSLISVSPSPFSCFTLHPCCSPTVTSTTPSRLWRPRLPCRALPDPKARVKRTSAWVPRSLATWPIPTHSTGYMSPSSPDKTTSVDGDTMPINDPDHDSISDFSRTTRENTGLFGVPTVCETSVSHSSW